MILQSFLLVLGFVVLVKGADWLVKGSVSLARQYHISELAIGLTIVAIGTSAPELVVNIISSFRGYNDITMGNIVGSNLFNTMLILGLSGVIYPLIVQVKTIRNEIPFSLIASLGLLLLANYSFNTGEVKSLDRMDGVILMILFVFFLVYLLKNLRNHSETGQTSYKTIKPGTIAILILIGMASLVLGSRLVVYNAVKIAQYIGISEKLIGITIISAGTSLPELATSVLAACRRKSDIAVGNIIGSNIFNISLILGISSLIRPIVYNSSFNFDILLLIGSTILLFAFMFSGRRYRLDRWESALLLAGYAGYIFFLIR